MTPEFRKQWTTNPYQDRLTGLIWQDPCAENILAFGPSRSGKTACLIANTVNRAMMFPGTHHAIFRRTRRSCISHLFQGTFPEIMGMLFPGYLDSAGVQVNRQDGTVLLHNGSKLTFDGLDPNNIDKVLGAQYATAWINECNEVEDYDIVQQLASRMADTVPMVDPQTGKIVREADGQPRMCRPLMLFDCNPDVKTDWDYQCFVEKKHPKNGKPFRSPLKWRRIHLPATANAGNLARGYLDSLEERYDGSPNMASRFLEGTWRDDNPHALFRKSMFRYQDDVAKEYLVRVIVAIDPSGSAGNSGDWTGIVVAGLGRDNKVYVLEDASVRAGSEEWARTAIDLYDKWQADNIVAERNYGGDMVRTTIRSARRNIEPKVVTATRGKLVRAEPVAQVYRKERVIHVGSFKELEAQMCDYKEGTKKSPDRMDALVWAVTELLDLNGEEQPGGGAAFVNKRFFF